MPSELANLLDVLYQVPQVIWIEIAVVLALVVLVLRLFEPRRFYFIRHGETILNKEHTRQGAQGGLTEAGKRQAEATGEFLSHFHIEKIIASPFERTKETAEAINRSLKVDIIYSPLLEERRNPSEIIGKKYEDPEVVKIISSIDLSYHDDSYRYSDEENFTDLKVRAARVLALLERQNAREVCVVTHGIFLKMLLSYLLYRDDLHTPAYVKLSFFNPSDNAAVTVCEYRPILKWFTSTRGWSIVSYNA